jgi:TfoX/Sxy family transcriptional regulator of competence genes
MAYDEGLATRLRNLLDAESGVSERKMFGGLAMMLHGNMAVGVYGESLLVRVDPQEWERLLRLPGVQEFAMSGRATKGFLVVSPDACAEDEDLAAWVARGLGYAGGLPPK